MLALHEDNSMLHQTVEVTVEFSLLNDPKLGRVVWLKEFRLADKVLSFWESSVSRAFLILAFEGSDEIGCSLRVLANESTSCVLHLPSACNRETFFLIAGYSGSALFLWILCGEQRPRLVCYN
mmetsp:Transcript_9077/g.39951  ORF Transcript_9077/g.39951 Transcript_9077/m.39951 type:complete len:123 (-) Transcript_9077:963-1331(-)